MPNLLHHRRLREDDEKREGGFTLIELMVVVLIMGILMAIAIPTFLSTRGSANDTSAKSNLSNALLTEDTYYTASTAQTWNTVLTSLDSAEPSLTWNVQTAAAIPATVNTVNVFESGTTLYLSDLSSSGACFDIQAVGGGAITYATQAKNSCAAAPSASGYASSWP